MLDHRTRVDPGPTRPPLSRAAERRPLPTAVELLAELRTAGVPFGIATSGRRRGYGEDELARAGAFRVYRDTSELRESLDELGLLS
jgi:beta-phosphoglucomutase-like phosphatase (HAD superfamily)